MIDAVPKFLDPRDVLQRAAESVPGTAVLASNSSSTSISTLEQVVTLGSTVQVPVVVGSS